MTQSAIRPVQVSLTSQVQPLGTTRLIDSAIAEAELAAAREVYRYNYSHIAPVPMVDRLPRAEMPTLSWWKKVIKIMASLLVNDAIARHGHDEQSAHQHVSGMLQQSLISILKKSSFKVQMKVVWHVLKISPNFLLTGFKVSLQDFEALLHSLVLSFEHDLVKQLHLGVKEQVVHTQAHQAEDCADCLSIYEDLFCSLELPAIAEYFHQDECFANFRVAGPNPLMLKRVRCQERLTAKFPLSHQQYQQVMGDDDSLELAISEGRLYLADYQMLEGALNGSFPHYQKYIDAPLALFAVPSYNTEPRHLRPVAIQCKQKPNPNNPIFTPPQSERDPAKHGWEMAKRVVQIADSNFHEAVTHLGRTHLFMSPFIIATHRQLPQSHPISLLLRPHFEGTLSINYGAHKMLMAPKGGVDGVLAATIDCARALAATGVCDYGFNRAMLPNQLEAHGLDDVTGLPHYPYRDDAILVWDAIADWVSDYIHHYYPDDQAVQDDRFLQAWATELQAFDGGRVQDFGEEGQLKTVDYLIQALTLLIFTASAQHAAVNFPQGDMMVFAPAMPLAGYQPAPTKTAMSHEVALQQLPPTHQALEQLELTYLLGQVYHTTLGQYPPDHFQDAKIQHSLKSFQERLVKIESIIDERNENRPYPYVYLKPSRIPQSINI